METVTYSDTPLGRFLSGSGADEDLVMEEHVHQGLSEDEGGDGSASGVAEGGRTVLNPETTSTLSTLPANHTQSTSSPETQLSEQFGNTLKYNLASSSLLNYNLSDALPLYPPLTSSTPPHPVPTPTPTTTSTNTRSKLNTVKPLEWPSDWHRRAESWQHRTPLENAFALGWWVVVTLFSIGSTVYNAPPHPLPPVQPSSSSTLTSAAKPALPPAVLPSWHTQFLDKVDGLVRASQELDLRAARALTGIKEVECIAWGLGLSEPLPPITRLEGHATKAPVSPTLRPRTSSPLAGSPSQSPRLGTTPEPHSPLPLRARALRATLSQSIASATQAYTNARVTLTEIETAAGFAPSPDVTDDEPVKHDAELELAADEGVPANETAEEKDARLEREWDAAQAAKRSRHKTQRSTWNGPAGAEDATFGGVDRNSLMVEGHRLSRRPSQGSHQKMRGSIGSIEVFAPAGTSQPLTRSSSLRTSVPVGQGRFGSPRRRPMSIGPGQVVRDPYHASSGLGSPTSHGYLGLAENEGQKDGLGLRELQEALDGLHGVRRGLLWRVLGLVDKQVHKETWAEVQVALVDLTTALAGQSRVVAKAVEAEFGSNGPGADAFAISTKASNNHLRQHGLTLDTARARPGSPYGWGSGGPSPAPVSGTRPLSLLGQSSSPLTPGIAASAARSTTARHARPLSATNFAPPNAVPTLGPAAGLASLEESNKAIGLALRSIAAKLHVVEADARHRFAAAAAGEEVESTRLVATHDSIRADLQVLLDEWEAGRVALRSAVRPVPPMSAPPLSRSNSWNDGGLADVSLSSIPDVTGEGEAEAEGADSASVFSSELHTPPTLAQGAPAARDAVADADRGSVLPPAGREQVFEAVAGQAGASPAGPKLSREERIRVMKERREARLSSGGVGGGGSPTKARGEGMGGAQMVEELKDVLQLLKARSQLPKEG